MQSITHRSRRVVERIAAAAPRPITRHARVRRTQSPRRRTSRHEGPALDSRALSEGRVEGCVQALGCLVWAAVACEPRVPLSALCDAAGELFEGLSPRSQRELVEKVMTMSPEQLAERGEMIVALATAPVRAERYVEFAEIRWAHEQGEIHAGKGSATDLASQAVVLVLDPCNHLGDVLPLAVELAERAAAVHEAYAPLAAALANECERHRAC